MCFSLTLEIFLSLSPLFLFKSLPNTKNILRDPKHIRSKRKMKKSIILLFSIAVVNSMSHAQNVDLFTGSYSNGIQLLAVPSNRGEAVQLTAVYNAGIRVKQSASDIGLGWELSGAGEISRGVQGYPDDLFNFVSYATKDINNIQTMNGQGALYPENRLIGTTNYDIGYYQNGLDSTEFAFPDYDNFNVRAPGLNGSMALKYFKPYEWNLKHFTYNGGNQGIIPFLPPFNLEPNALNVPRDPQFHFRNSYHGKLTSRHYPTAGSLTYVNPTTSINDAIFPAGSSEGYVGKEINAGVGVPNNFHSGTGRLATENFVEYIRNGEIDTAAGVVPGFLDYKSGHSRPAVDFPVEGIGYIRVTNAQGYSYHYALPVYQRGSTNYSIPLENDYSLSTNVTNLSFSNQNNPLLHPGNRMVILRQSDNNTYATKWLLTAITGPDYQDDGNKYPDEADAGYWVRYDYVQWSSLFTNRYPQYGYDYSFRPDARTEEMPSYMPQVPGNQNSPDARYKLSGNWASANATEGDIYYLNKIRTSSHTAVFVRDVRLDEKGGYTEHQVPTTLPTPQLKLVHILLFKNDDFNSLFTNYSNPFNPTNYTFADFSKTTNSDPNSPYYGKIFNLAWYQGHSVWDAYVLGHVEFDQNYSLCKGYHSNFKVTANSTGVLTKQSTVQTSISNSDISNSGKLTLNRILIYDYQNVKLAPSTKFTYDYNPDFHPIKEDNWGFFKSDATQEGHSKYTTSTSQASTKAWSLWQIENALGAKQQINYESNTYNRVLDDESTAGVRGAAFIYRIKQASSIEKNYSVLMEEGAGATNQLSEFIGFCTSNIAGLKKRISLSAVRNDIMPGATCIGCKTKLKTFFWGDCSVNLTQTGGNSNVVNGIISTTCQSNSNCANPIAARLIAGTEGKNYSYSYGGFNDQTAMEDEWKAPYIQGITYSGNGFLMFETPVGYNVYGNGIRVASIKTINENGEEYTKAFEYFDGVAMNELDRFEFPRKRRGCNDQSGGGYNSPAKYTYLKSKDFGPFSNPFQLGYSKVVEKDLGRVPVANGRKETYFLTDPMYNNGAFFGSNVISTNAVETSANNIHPTAIKTVNECKRKFLAAFGMQTEERYFDKNDILLSKRVQDFEMSEQGAVVEVFHFTDPYWFAAHPDLFLYLFGLQNSPFSWNDDAKNSCISYTTNILREYAIRVKGTTTYQMGAQAKQEVLKFDELTGKPLAVRYLDQNGNTSTIFETPAYSIYQPPAGLFFWMENYRKLLPLREKFFSYSSVDSTLTNSSTFSGAGYNIYSNLVKIRTWLGGVYGTSNFTLPYYFNNRTFVFDAGVGSANDYGLFDKTSLYQNPLSFGNTYYWEPGTTTYNWRLKKEVTLIDEYWHAVESRDEINRFNAARYAYSGNHKTATATNCNYSSFTYAGFERYAGSVASRFEGELIFTNTRAITNSIAHTGIGALIIPNGNPVSYVTRSEFSSGGLELGIMAGRMYRTGVWVHNTNLASAKLSIYLNGFINNVPVQVTYNANSTTDLAATIDGWNLIQVDFEVPEGFTTINQGNNVGSVNVEISSTNGNITVDDFILHPVESEFSATVFDLRTDWITARLDGNGISTRYVYDASGKIKEEWKELPSYSTLKKTRSLVFNYARGASN